ncbi:hypothetical protein [Nocardia sp. NPDC059691]|uniref:hypothetical protein n=1 Tax=Nocardia sp. NPDC059691 TaxID=3346908 RepID=UPI0036AB37B2
MENAHPNHAHRIPIQRRPQRGVGRDRVAAAQAGGLDQQRDPPPGLSIQVARNTAMIAILADIPVTVVSDLLGVSPATAERRSRYAQNDWARYLPDTEPD